MNSYEHPAGRGRRIDRHRHHRRARGRRLCGHLHCDSIAGRDAHAAPAELFGAGHRCHADRRRRHREPGPGARADPRLAGDHPVGPATRSIPRCARARPGLSNISPSPSISRNWRARCARRWARAAICDAPASDDGGTQGLPLVGRSAPMQAVYRMITRVLRNDLTVLILGESGTGKELVAEAIHQLGHRRDGPFVAVNTAAIPGELIESELFGHERGGFHGRGGAARRQIRAGRRGHAVPRRNRRHADAGADPAAARLAIGQHSPGRRARRGHGSTRGSSRRPTRISNR